MPQIVYRIKRDSIRKNPEAGRTTSIIQGTISRSKTVVSKNDDGFLVKEFSWIGHQNHWRLKSCRSVPIPPLPIGEYVEDERNFQQISHLPLPEFLFEYDDPEIECEHCGKTEVATKWPREYDSEDEEIYLCPHCRHGLQGTVMHEQMSDMILEEVGIVR